MATPKQLSIPTVILLLCTARGFADRILDYNTTIDYTIEADPNDEGAGVLIVEGTNANPPTVVNIVEPAYINRDVTLRDASVLNVYGGRLNGHDDGLGAIDNSTVSLYGGEFSSPGAAVSAYGHATINIYDGLIHNETDAEGWSTINIFGGAFEAAIDANDEQARVYIHGGIIPGLRVDEQCVITVYGRDFNFPYGPIGDSSGTLIGTLAGGDLINAPFEILSEGSIVLAVPEPPSVLLSVLAVLGLGTLRRC
jgi:hypothetical protein